MSIKSVIGASVVSSFATTALLTMHPAAYAASAFATVASAVSCATSGSCVSGSNTSSGPGVSGTSAKGYGVEGISTSNDGLKGISTSSNGLSASSTSSYGVKGESSTNYAVYAASKSGGGVLATTSNTSDTKQAAVTGNDLSTNGSDNDGVLGTVTNGNYGVEGTSGDDARGGVAGSATSGVGVRAASNSGQALVAQSTSDEALFAMTSSGHEAAEIANRGGAVGLVAEAGIVAIQGIGLGHGDPLMLQTSNGSQTSTVFYVDANGNVHYAGSLESFAETPSGATVSSYGTTTTRPTVEDTGTAHLTAGTAAVALDPTFAATIDRTSAYRVFITPAGETRGLFVASRSLRGFTVREVQGGRSSTDFDYRIVAIAAGHADQHMARIDPASIPNMPMPKPHVARTRTRATR